MATLKRIFFLFLLLALCFTGTDAKKVLKVLAIGNSFSEDAVEQYLYELAAAQGDSLVIGNAYIGGCSIDRHWNNAQTGKAEYAYRKVVGGKLTDHKNVALKEIIRDEPWDIITLQQASHDSGLPDTYRNLGKLRDYVRSEAIKPKVRIAFHMTWAYAQNSSHGGFKNYGNDQIKMYRAICQTVRQETRQYGIKKIIPSGIAIQNARTSIGDKLNRDGFHLDYGIGRYTAACTWCRFLTKKKVTGNPYSPKSVDATTASVLQQAADEAFRKMKKIF